MLKNIFIFILLCSLPIWVIGQASNSTSGRSNEIEQYRIAYLKEKLDLSAAEAKIFWPIFYDWKKEQALVRKQRPQKMISFRKLTEIEELSDTEVQNLIANEMAFKQKELNIEKKYYARLKSSLPIKIIGKYYRAQETFKKELLNRYRNNRPQSD
jgi:hypothetical protein